MDKYEWYRLRKILGGLCFNIKTLFLLLALGLTEVYDGHNQYLSKYFCLIYCIIKTDKNFGAGIVRKQKYVGTEGKKRGFII